MRWIAPDGETSEITCLECDRCGKRTAWQREPFNFNRWHADGWRVIGSARMTLDEDAHLCPTCAAQNGKDGWDE